MTTLQEMFNKICQHATKGKKSVNDGLRDEDCVNSCYYRHPETGAKCFIGALIPDEEYRLTFEGNSYDRVDIKAAIGIDTGDDSYDHFLSVMQEIHDNWESYGWEEQLHALANEYKLEMPKLDWSACA